MNFDSLNVALDQFDELDFKSNLEELDAVVERAMMLELTMEEYEVLDDINTLGKALCALVALEEYPQDGTLLHMVLMNNEMPEGTSFVSATEGFTDTIRKFFNKIVEFIRKLIKNIHDFIFGKSQEDIAADTAKEVKSFLEDEDRARQAITELQSQIGKGEGAIQSFLRLAGISKEITFVGFSADEVSAVHERINTILGHLKDVNNTAQPIPDAIMAAADIFSGNKAIKPSSDLKMAATWDADKINAASAEQQKLAVLFDSVKKSYYMPMTKRLQDLERMASSLNSNNDNIVLDYIDSTGKQRRINGKDDPKTVTAVLRQLIKDSQVKIRLYMMCSTYFDLVDKTISSYLKNAKLIKKAIDANEDNQQTAAENND